MPDIAFIGDRDSVWGFSAFGAAAVPVAGSEEARAAFDEAVRGGTSVIFVTEDVYEACAEQIDALRSETLPTVTVLPGVTGARGIAAAEIHEAVSAAVGADIFGEESAAG
ncbi:MAG: V-type ATP synthase subunit F [Candidatus Eisenbacteria bacterium]|nr:V-type ATP synthase subunit F [Candidatus Eisenbacteria bacterium]